MYTIHCRHYGREFALAWNDGGFTGDENAVLLLEVLAEVYENERRPVGAPGGPIADGQYLMDPFSALWLARELFEITGASGDVPERDPAPEGAVI